MAFTASTMNRVNVRLNAMFAEPSTAQTEYNEPAEVLKWLLANQTATADPILQGDKCVGVKAWFVRTSGITTVATPSDCTTPTGNPAETLSKNFTTEVFTGSAGIANSLRCDNELDFIEESAAVLRRLITVARKKLNETVIGRLAANGQSNIDLGIPDFWDGTSSPGKILVPATDFKWEMIGEFDATVKNNNFGQYAMVNGRSNFYQDAWVQSYLRSNADGPAGSLAYGDANMVFDIRDMDVLIGQKQTLAIDLNSFIFWNTTFSPSTPTQMFDEKWMWTVADPEVNVRVGNQLAPLLYEVEMERTCTGRNANSQLVYQYKWYVRPVGGFGFVPQGPEGETGTLIFEKA